MLLAVSVIDSANREKAETTVFSRINGKGGNGTRGSGEVDKIAVSVYQGLK